MTLEYAILGFLNYKESTGYDLKKMIDTSIRHFWPADQSQIYRTLGKLIKKEWAEMHIVEQDGKPNRKVYTLTQTGKNALHEWLQTPLPLEEIRSSTMIQVFFGAQLGNDEIVSNMKNMVKGLHQVLAQYQKVPEQSQPYVELVDSPRDVFFWMLTLEMGARRVKTEIEWAESAIHRIESGDYSPDFRFLED